MSKTMKAGALLSRYLKELANELSQDGKTTKAELLARKIWDLALGVGPPRVSASGVVLPPVPDKEMISLVFDRLEGKVGSYDENQQRIENIPNKVGKAAVQHISQLAIKNKVA